MSNKLFININTEINTNAALTHIHINIEITKRNTQGTSLLLNNRPWKNPMQENRCGRYEDFIIMLFLNTNRVPEMAHLTDNSLGSSTSPWRQIFRLINHLMNDPTIAMITSIALHHSDRDSNTLSTH